MFSLDLEKSMTIQPMLKNCGTSGKTQAKFYAVLITNNVFSCNFAIFLPFWQFNGDCLVNEAFFGESYVFLLLWAN